MTCRKHSLSPFSSFSFARRPGVLLLVLAVALSLGGCKKGDNETSAAAEPAVAYGGSMQRKSARLEAAAPPAAATASDQAQDTPLQQRFLAVRQELNVEVPPEQLADAWGKVRDLCGTLQCELLSSSLHLRRRRGAGQGNCRGQPALGKGHQARRDQN